MHVPVLLLPSAAAVFLPLCRSSGLRVSSAGFVLSHLPRRGRPMAGRGSSSGSSRDTAGASNNAGILHKWKSEKKASHVSLMAAMMDGPRAEGQACTTQLLDGVFHVALHKDAHVPVSQLLTEECQLPNERVKELLALGSVFTASIQPEASPGALAGNKRKAKKRPRPASPPSSPSSSAPHPADKSTANLPFSLSKVQRVTGARLDELEEGMLAIVKGTYFRLHSQPSRYEVGPLEEWRKRILLEGGGDKGFVAVNKPAGVPSTPSVDNGLECAMTQASLALGEELAAVARLDVPTSGVLLLARSSWAAGKLGKLIMANKVHKTYHVYTEGDEPPPLGTVKHWCRPKKKLAGPPRIYFPAGEGECEEGWQLAEMEVLSVTKLEQEEQEKNGEEEGEKVNKKKKDKKEEEEEEEEGEEGKDQRVKKQRWESEVRLVTGRTHQIRLQMAALGHGVVGDTRYEGVVGMVHDGNPETDDSCVALYGDMSLTLGLHCSSLAFPWGEDGEEGEDVRIDAGAPWWR